MSHPMATSTPVPKPNLSPEQRRDHVAPAAETAVAG
jgi:hypothetical protein